MSPQFHTEFVRQQQLDLQRRLARPRRPSPFRKQESAGGTPVRQSASEALLTRLTPLLLRRQRV